MSVSSLVLYKKDSSGTYTYYDSIENSYQLCEKVFNQSTTCWAEDTSSTFRLDLVDSETGVISSKELIPTTTPTPGYF